MMNNKCTVLATVAEMDENIDVARANAAKERAEARLQAKTEDIDVKRASLALKRAIMRIRTASTR